jgi:hypothetical protein
MGTYYLNKIFTEMSNFITQKMIQSSQQLLLFNFENIIYI